MSNGEIWENLPDEVSADGDGNDDDDVADDSDVDNLISYRSASKLSHLVQI